MARALWSGHIVFGMVSVPVKLMTATRPNDIAFHMMSPDGQCRLRTKLVCPETGEEYEFGKTAQGYEIGPGQYVLLDREEIKKLKPESGRAIHVDRFVDPGDVDPIYFDRSYYLAPGKDGAAKFRLFVEALSDAGKAAIAKMVMRGKEYIVLIRVTKDVLVAQTMHYADEVLDAADAGIKIGDVKVTKAEEEMAEHLVKALTRPLKIKEFKDEYRGRIMDLIKRRAAGEEVVLPAVEEIPPTYNIADALKKSLEQVGAKPRTKRKSPARKRRKAG